MATKYSLTDWVFWDIAERKSKEFRDSLKQTGDELNTWIDADARAKQDLIRNGNQQYRDDLYWFSEDTAKVQREYEKRIKQQRDQSDKILDQEKAWVWLEAQIQAAAAWRSWKISQWQLSKLGSDITNRFNQALSASEKNNLEFNQWLDENLKNVWMDSIEKQKIISALENILDKEEIEPLLSAISSKAKNREDFLKIFSSFYSELKKDEIKWTYERGEEEQRYQQIVEVLKNQTPEQRRIYAAWRLSWTWLTLPADERENFLKAIESWMDPVAALSFISDIKARDAINKSILTTAAWHEAIASGQLGWIQAWDTTFNEATQWVDTSNNVVRTETTNNADGSTTTNEYNANWDIVSWGGWPVRNITPVPEDVVEDDNLVRIQPVPSKENPEPTDEAKVQAYQTKISAYRNDYAPNKDYQEKYTEIAKAFREQFDQYKTTDPIKYYSMLTKVMDSFISKWYLIKK